MALYFSGISQSNKMNSKYFLKMSFIQKPSGHMSAPGAGMAEAPCVCVSLSTSLSVIAIWCFHVTASDGLT